MNEIAALADKVEQVREGLPNSGCVDLQVNGYAGIDFNGIPLELSQLLELCARLEQDGVSSILATVITAPIDMMLARIRALSDAICANAKVAERICGLHIEGPFISPEPGYVGAHPVSAVRKANLKDCQKLLDAGQGKIRLWTLAPEMDDDAIITGELVRQGVKVAAGHSNASLDQLRQAIDQGLCMYTHLGNGCPGVMPRHDNIVQRVLSLSDRLRISFIADGHHVPSFALKNYLKCVPLENVIVVSDCMSAAGLGPGTYPLGDQKVYVDQNLAAWSEDRQHFAGSATTLPQMQQILRQQLEVPAEQIDLFTRVNPLSLLEA